MKTHEFAYALEQMAKALRSQPNMDIRNLIKIVSVDQSQLVSDRIAPNLTTLATLSQFSKGQWKEIIDVYELPVVIRPRDAARDVLGKILRYLNDNPSARKDLLRGSLPNKGAVSKELMRTLDFLLEHDG